MSDTADLIASAALMVSFGSVVYARRAWQASERQAQAAGTQARLASQQEGERRVAQRRAQLRAVMVRHTHRGILRIHNEGAAPATDVCVHASTPTEPESGAAQFVFRDVRGLQRLAAGSTAEQHLCTVDQIPARYHVALEWTNADGSHGEWSSDLTFVS